MAKPSRPPDLDFYVIFGAAVRPDGSPSATLRHRVEGSFAMARSNPDAAFLVTGGRGRHGPSEAKVMRRLLLELGAKNDRVFIEDAARDTLDSAVLCSQILKARRDVRSVTACSSRYHVDRCRALLLLAGVKAAAGSVRSDRRQLGTLRWLYHWSRDLTILPLDVLLMLVPQRRSLAERRASPGD